MPLYSSRLLSDAFVIGIRVTKFDDDLNPVVSYEVTAKTCTCPAGEDRACKHRNKFMTLLSIADTGAFFNFDDHSIHTLEDLNASDADG